MGVSMIHLRPVTLMWKPSVSENQAPNMCSAKMSRLLWKPLDHRLIREVCSQCSKCVYREERHGKAASQLGYAQVTEGPSWETKVYAGFWEIAEAWRCGT